jgi:hypothetical protein
MSTARDVLIVLTWSCFVSPTDAQETNRVEAAIADLEADGRPSDLKLFLFQGCPQEDPAGVAVFEAVQDMPLDPWGLTDLARAFTFRAYPNCGYAPLNAWYVRAFERLRADGALGPAEAFVIGLANNEARLVNRDMQEALLQGAEDPGFIGGRYEEEMVRIALSHRPRDLWISEALAAFHRTIPRQSVASATYRLSRELGSEFYEEIARQASTLDDVAFFTIVHALASEIQDERADPNAAGMEALRTMAASRARYPWDELPRARRPPIR